MSTGNDANVSYDIVWTKDAIIPNLKHISSCLKHLMEHSDLNESLQNFDLLITLGQKQQELDLKEQKLKQQERKLMESNNAIKSKQFELELKEEQLKLQQIKIKEELKMLNNDKEVFELKKSQQKQQLALVLLQSKKNAESTQRLQQREQDLLQREAVLLQKEHDLYQKEKEISKMEAEAKLRNSAQQQFCRQ